MHYKRWQIKTNPNTYKKAPADRRYQNCEILKTNLLKLFLEAFEITKSDLALYIRSLRSKNRNLYKESLEKELVDSWL